MRRKFKQKAHECLSEYAMVITQGRTTNELDALALKFLSGCTREQFIKLMKDYEICVDYFDEENMHFTFTREKREWLERADYEDIALDFSVELFNWFKKGVRRN